MSKCGINRYKPGGRCGSFETNVKGNDGGGAQLSNSFSAILAAREAQDAAIKAPPAKQYATPALTQVATSQALVLSSVGTSHYATDAKLWHPAVVKQPQVFGQNLSNKQKDIDMILQGDFD
jgi:hypothetical protein